MADYTNWPQIDRIPNPNPQYSVLQNPNQSHGYSRSLEYDPYQLSNSHSESALFMPPQPRPPGVDSPYVAQPAAAHYVHQPIVFETQQGVDAAASAAAAAYYTDPNVSWAAPTPQFGTTPYAAVVSAPNPAIQPEKRQKKTKVMQSAWCEVCKLDCNSKVVLDQHKLGKKHIKNLQKLETATPTMHAPNVATPPTSLVTSTSLAVPTPAPIPAHTDKPLLFIGPQQKPKSRKKAAAGTEDLETKRRKVLEGGAAADAVRACKICNVVCNSDTVYNYHIAGQKHAAMSKKRALGAGLAHVA